MAMHDKHHSREVFVHEVLDILSRFKDPSIIVGALDGGTVLTNMQSAINDTRRRWETDNPIEWETVFITIGYHAYTACKNQHISNPASAAFANFLYDKSVRYGYAPLIRWGPLGILIRIDSKTGRLSTLDEEPYLGRKVDESAMDTWVDILGYAILGVMLTKGFIR